MSRQLLVFVTASVGLATAALVGQQADTVINPFNDNPAAIAAGQSTYAAACVTCHGPAGQGDNERGAPPLNTTGLQSGDSDADMFRTIRNGISGTEMSGFTELTDQQIWEVIAYLRTLQGRAPARSGNAAGAAPAAAAVAAGESLFFGTKANCSSCHEVNGRGGVVGPDLSDAGALGAAALRQKIVSPNTPVAAAGRGAARGGGRGGFGRGGRGGGATTVIARTRDGQTIRGIRRNEDTFSLQMVDADGRLHLLDKRTLASVAVDETSLMPADYGTRLSDAEIDALVAYLGAQTGRAEAVATTPATTGAVITYERLVRSSSEPHNWPMYWGDYHGTHYSPLDQITPRNVGRLRPAWTFPIVGGGVLEGTPLVVDGVMYATGSGNPTTVVALDARTGREIWRYTRQQKTINPYQINAYSRGVSILGNRVYVGTLDTALIALDARTGRQLWEVTVADTMEGMTITSPPLVLRDKVIVGTSGGEYPTRGRLDAFDAATGRHLWRFYTIPGPGEPGKDTWKGDSWQTGGGPTWLTGTFDPELNTIYWPVGNPAAQIDRSVRGDGDNLYTESVIALDPDTGTLKWHFQFTPNDGHDWDSTEDMVLVDRMWRGQNRKLLLHADRNGHFYVLDRTNGKFLAATPFVYQNWNTGFTESGRPIPVPGSNSRPDADVLVYPSLGGGTNFQAPSYSPVTGWFYLSFAENGQQFVSAPQEPTRGQQYTGRGRASQPAARGPNDPEPRSGVKAIDPETGKTMWEFPTFQGSNSNGVLATAGNVVFASVRDGNIVALDAKTGQYLWHFQTNGSHAASPMSYGVGGMQYVALSAGNVIFSFALAE